MEYISPPRLKSGQHIRIISPSGSLASVKPQCIEAASARLSAMGFQISFSQNALVKNSFGSSSIENRVSDIHEAFSDESVHAILSVIGGYTANELLEYIDYSLLRANPKIFCGFSDISILCNAITSRAGIITYMGPHFSSFGMELGFDFSQSSFVESLATVDTYEITNSSHWSDDKWFTNQMERTFILNDGPWLINPIDGSWTGHLVGGYLNGFIALNGTGFRPSLQNTILLVEEIATTNIETFGRLLTAITQQNDFSGVLAIIIGRFPNKCQIHRHTLERMILSNPKLKNIPIIANMDFGHTTPILTLPIGGVVELLVERNNCKLSVLKH